MAMRIFTLRVRRARRRARSHARATSMLNRHSSGASGSSPSMMPMRSSFGAS
jgi:hypothetical protein